MTERSDPAHDFDFEFGTWRVAHRRLKVRLAGCTDWETFEGTADVRPILGGTGNVEDNVIGLPGDGYRAIALRACDAASGRWSIWWIDARDPHRIDVPVVGSFADGVGTFYADDTLDGAPIRLRFLWLGTDTPTPRWEQAMSADGGATWETNWTMDFSRS